MALKTETVLVLSTAHITPETADALDDANSALRRGMILRENGEFGWFTRVSLAEYVCVNDLPEDLRRCLLFAKRTDHDWLLLDADGPKEDFLTQYG